MKDCKLTITVRNDNINTQMENISITELATLSGYLQMLVGQEAVAGGVGMEDIKSNMLDIHLEAMEALEEHVRKGMLKINGSS